MSGYYWRRLAGEYDAPEQPSSKGDIVVSTTVRLKGEEVAKAVTRHQQRQRRQGPKKS